MMGRPIKIGSLFAAVLAKANDADVMLFSDDAKYVALNKRDSTLTLARWLESQCASAGTNFHSIFQRANRAYDRVIILSDMQGWIGGHAPNVHVRAVENQAALRPEGLFLLTSTATAPCNSPSETYTPSPAGRTRPWKPSSS